MTRRPLAEALRDRDGSPYGHSVSQRLAARVPTGGLFGRLAARASIRRPARTVAILVHIAGAVAAAFLVAAMKDPLGANLDRVQIVKGWLEPDGATHERIYDVAVSGGRTIGPDGRCLTPIGNTVDVATGKYSNDIGATELAAVWRDPDFDAKQRAFYYARVLEIPTPRYSLLDSIALGKPWEDTGRPATIQERVYGSPIWYTP